VKKNALAEAMDAEDEEDDTTMAKRDTAKAIISAVKRGDEGGLMEALDAYHDLCAAYEEEEEESE
jgi:hypothetical protein